jgi:hypothetical protein
MMLETESHKIKLSACSFGIAIGVAEGLYMLLFAWAGWFWGYGTPLIVQIAYVFYGYAPSFIGGILGGIWGFVDGFIFGFIVGWIYNLCLCCRCRKSSTSSENKT